MKTHTFIPESLPETPLLDSINSPADLKPLNSEQLKILADELRAFLIYSVNQSGGHFAAGLGVIELTIALHHVFFMPEDKILWDVGHQAYPHKILTGRKQMLGSIRQKDGLTPFPKPSESVYDIFGTGHSSTSISAALGMAIADKLRYKSHHNIAVIGDGAMTAGMVFEAMNHAGDIKPNLLVILNDNNMSISNNVGALSNYFAQLFSGKIYSNTRSLLKKMFKQIPCLLELAKRFEVNSKGFVVPPSSLFEALGFNYIGPIDGHDLDTLLKTLINMKALSGPQILHVKTVKGKGFVPAEREPIKYHALKPANSKQLLTGQEKTSQQTKKQKSYSNIFGDWLCDMAAQDSRLVGITPAMREGSDMVEFSRRYPERYFDVAIAEQHAVTFSAGLAVNGLKPVVAIYSTFLQRAYDQFIHDVAIQHLDVLFAVDRAGLVGEDGCTHDGSFDLSFLQCIPNILLMAPANEVEMRLMLTTGYHYPGPAVVRYPKGKCTDFKPSPDLSTLPISKAELVYQTKNYSNCSNKSQIQLVVFAFGTLVNQAVAAVKQIEQDDTYKTCVLSVVNMRFIKPLDIEMIHQMAAQANLLVTVEENALIGGAGSAVNQALQASPQHTKPVLNLGLADHFFHHGTRAENLIQAGLDSAGIKKALLEFIEKI